MYVGLISQSVNVDLESIGYYNLGTHIGVNEKPREHQFCCCKIFNLVDIGCALILFSFFCRNAFGR